MAINYAYAADITKAERDEYGDLIVFGKATGPDLDSDEQVCDADWLKSAMPAWMVWGNLREMHGPICAGVGIELNADGDDWLLKSKVIDDGTAKKIEAGGLKGYSVGIKNAKVVRDKAAPGGRIVSGDICEISYVDRPCNPTARLMISKMDGGNTLRPVDTDGIVLEADEDKKTFTPADMAAILNKLHKQVKADEQAEQTAPAAGEDIDKRDVSSKERSGLADRGAALKDGSFPIANVKDLKNAIRAVGRAKDPEKAKAHIKRRASALGHPELVPKWWKSVGADTTKDDGEPGGGMRHNPEDLKAIRQSLVDLLKAELDELLEGEDEFADISQLLCTLRMFTNWWEDEAAAAETESPFTEPRAIEREVVLMADAPDTVKTASEGEPTDAPETTEPETTEPETAAPVVETAAAEDTTSTEEKSASADGAKIAASVSEERINALETTIAEMRDQLTKALALPEPGGPVVTRTAAQATSAKITDVELLKMEAGRLISKALEVQRTDPRLAAGYRERAAKILKDAA